MNTTAHNLCEAHPGVRASHIGLYPSGDAAFACPACARVMRTAGLEVDTIATFNRSWERAAESVLSTDLARARHHRALRVTREACVVVTDPSGAEVGRLPGADLASAVSEWMLARRCSFRQAEEASNRRVAWDPATGFVLFRFAQALSPVTEMI